MVKTAILRLRKSWIAAFTLLCVLASSRWLLEGAYPQSASTPFSQAAGCGLAALCFAALRSSHERQPKRFFALPVAGAGKRVICTALLLVGPALSTAIAGRRLHADDATLAMALVPTIVAVAASLGREDASSDITGMMWPGLAGLAGLLLLLPQPSFSRLLPWIGLVSLPVILGATATLLRASPPAVAPQGDRSDAAWAFAAGSAAAGICFLLLALGRAEGFPSGGPTWFAAGLDAVLFVLTLWTLDRVGAAAWSAQFLLVPLLTLAEGIGFLHPVLDFRSWLGLGLLGLGAVRLLFYGRPQEGSTTGLF